MPTSSLTTSFDKRLLMGGIVNSDGIKAIKDQVMRSDDSADAIIVKPTPLLKKPRAATIESGKFKLGMNFTQRVKPIRAEPRVMELIEFHPLY